MILIVDTTQSHEGKRLAEAAKGTEYEWIDASKMNISPCIGCNHCWLKTPGICAVKDDHEQILQKAVAADRLWLAADTRFGFISYKCKNIVDRLIPLVMMNLYIKNGEMRHIPRYDRLPELGLIYCGDGDKEYLNRWVKRMALNLGVDSPGAYSADEIQEAASCIL